MSFRKDARKLFHLVTPDDCSPRYDAFMLHVPAALDAAYKAGQREAMGPFPSPGSTVLSLRSNDGEQHCRIDRYVTEADMTPGILPLIAAAMLFEFKSAIKKARKK